jgi:peptide-methionine (S)-S-oxide reductase
MKLLSLLITAFLFSSCVDSQTQKLNFPVGSPKPMANEAVADFSEGCFWHAEIVFQSLAGVRDAVSGYAGGTAVNPSYEDVATGNTGHAETVQVYYDPTKISYETLVKAFFASLDPTELNHQGNDEGTEYRSIIFYRTQKEKEIVDAQIKSITDAKVYSRPIVTQVVPFKTFYKAEDYHQEYIHNNPSSGYVQAVSIPDYLEFRKKFKGNFK